MNRLPQHRCALSERTFSSPWSASDYDPIRHYRSTARWSERGIVVLAVVFAGLLMLGVA